MKTSTIRKGKRFGFLKTIEFIKIEYRKNRFTHNWVCKCDCGNIRNFTERALITGHNYSCGCKAGLGNLKTGISTSLFYRKWDGINRRCTDTKASHYKQYGARGIKVEWKNFEEFKKDMYKSYLKHQNLYGDKETTIDRINVNGNYLKENCRWATNKEQGRNRRNNVYVDFKGNKIVASAFCELTGLNKTTVCRKIKLKWSGKKMIHELRK